MDHKVLPMKDTYKSFCAFSKSKRKERKRSDEELESSFSCLDLCRLCLGKDIVSVPIFENEKYSEIFHKITTCGLPVKVSGEDKLPKKICNDCVKKVELFYQFWNMTLNARNQLLQLVDEVTLEHILTSRLVELDCNKNRFDDTVIQVSDHLNNIHMDSFDNVSMITASAANDKLFTAISLDSSSTFSGLSVETGEEESQDKKSASSGLEQQKISEISETLIHYTDNSDAKNRMLELAILEAVPLSNFSSYPEPVYSPSSYLRDISSPVSYLEHISNLTCDEIPSSALFLDHLSDSTSDPSSCFDKFPDPEFIADYELLPFSNHEILNSIPEPELIPNTNLESEIISRTISSPVFELSSLSFEEPILGTSTLNVNARLTKKRATRKSTAKKWSIANKDRPRRFRDRHYCRVCLCSFSDKAKLGQHLVQEHNVERPFDCDVCGRSFRSAVNINRHKRLHDEKPKFSCDRCDYATNQKSNLTTHIKRRHDKNYTFRCQQCHAGFMQRTKFVEHQALHESLGIRHACKHCLKTFRYKRNLRQHTVEHHPETIPGPVEPKSRIPCPLCNRMFAKEQSLQHHVKVQHSQPNKKILCGECGAQLSCKSALTQHMRSHRGEKVAVCNICDKGFAKWQNLRVHERVHTGERPYKCTHCSKAFAQRTTLVHHTRIHTGERPYKCAQCDKGFVSGSLLKKHTARCQNAQKKEAPKSDC